MQRSACGVPRFIVQSKITQSLHTPPGSFLLRPTSRGASSQHCGGLGCFSIDGPVGQICIPNEQLLLQKRCTQGMYKLRGSRAARTEHKSSNSPPDNQRITTPLISDPVIDIDVAEITEIARSLASREQFILQHQQWRTPNDRTRAYKDVDVCLSYWNHTAI